MNTRILHIVDMFGETKFTGNQLAVYLNVGDLTNEQMQGIPKEMYLSETAFIVSESQPTGGYDVRIFAQRRKCLLPGIQPWVRRMSSRARYCRSL